MDILSGIKNIIFDLGNVVLDIDLNITIKRFQEMGFVREENFLNKYRQEGIFHDYEIGLITSDEFLDKISEKMNKVNPRNEIKEAWLALLLEYDQERIECILELGKKYRTFLLSNTNELHIESCKNSVPLAGSLNNLFEKNYLSFELGVSKPDKKIFEFVLQDAGLDPKETLFLDDSLANIESARELGLRCWHIEDSKKWAMELNKQLVINKEA